jgi:hypothetical protein
VTDGVAWKLKGKVETKEKGEEESERSLVQRSSKAK